MTPPVSADPPQIPDYQLLRLVGHGAYGDVWLARSLTGTYRAVKVVWRDRFREPHPYEREFNGLREFARVSINEHRQLALLHVGRNDAAGFFYYVMELADDVEQGRNINPETYAPLTLKRYREKGCRLAVSEVVAHAIDLCRALSSLHGHGLVHRDIKPSNLILVEGRPKLADVGLVTLAAEAGTYVGTEGFVPPEGPGTPAADVFSLGKVLYELATGRDRNDFPRLPLDLHTRSDRAELMELNEVIVRACDPTPFGRYTDAEAMLNELLLLQAGRSVRRLRLTERGLAQARRIVFALIVVTTIAFGGAFLERQRAEAEAAGRRSAEAERDALARLTLYSGGLSRAQRALETGDYGRARELLRELIPADPVNEDLRGFEWRALWHEAQGDPAEVIRDRGPSIDRIYFSSDGTRFVVHDISKTATVYDTGSLKPSSVVRGIHRLGGFSTDGEWLLGITPEYHLQAWNVVTGSPMSQSQHGQIAFPIVPVPGPGVRMLIFAGSADSQPPQLKVWDLASGAEIRSWSLSEPAAPLWQIRVADVAVQGSVCSLILQYGWSFSSTFQQLLIDLDKTSCPEAWAAPLTTNQMPAGLHAQQIITAVDFPTTSLSVALPLQKQISGTSEINAIAFSPGGRLLSVGTKRGAIRIYDRLSGEELYQLRGHAGGIASITWSPDGTTLLTADNAGHARKWSMMPSLKRKRSIEHRPAEPGFRQVHFSQDNLLLAADVGDSAVVVYDAQTLRPLLTLENASRPIGFLGDSSLLSVGPNGELQHWDVDGAKIHEENLPWTTGTTTAVVYQGGKTIAATSSGGEILIKSLLPGAGHPLLIATGGKVSALALAPASVRCAAVVNGVHVKTWRSSDGTEEVSQQFAAPVEELQFSPNGAFITVSMANGDVAVLDLKKRAAAHTIRVGTASAHAIFTPDGSRLLCGTRTGLIHVYRTTDWREITTLENQKSPSEDMNAAAMAFSPDGKSLAIHRHDGKLRLWRAP